MTTRWVFCTALFVYACGLFVLALWPTDDINWIEWVAAAAAVVAVVGLIAHAVPDIRIPGEDYAYLITGAAGLLTMLSYLVDSDAPDHRQTFVALLLSTGIIAGYGAFLAEPRIGGRYGREH